jgi:hypothetical protein
MMKRFVRFPVAVLAVAAMLEAFPVLVRAQQPVPFKGSAELTLEMDGTVAGTGQGTQLGRFSEMAMFTELTLPTATMDGTFSANVFLTAANGDVVNKFAWGSVTQVGDLLIFAGSFLVEPGGTGRFADATGLGQVDMVLYPDDTITQTYDGTIQY